MISIINVTKSSMPRFGDYVERIKKLWNSGWLTNNGKNLLELERKLKKYLGVKNIIIVSSGTLALQIALESFNFEPGSEIITTPFSFIATSSSIAWQKFVPIFADIDEKTWNIDPKSLEKKINEKTRAILPTHVFGNPVDIEQIDRIAKKYSLKVIYDAAHCFGVEYKGKSVFKHGDISIVSFHATKVFHTIEGGALFTENDDLVGKIKRLRNFGFSENSDEVMDIGINAKMNEFQAIMGLLNLEKVDFWIKQRKKITEIYDGELKGKVEKQQINPYLTKYNYIYYPVLFKNKEERDYVFEKLKNNKINARKYFYPLINNFSAYKRYNRGATPVAEKISNRILHLPLYPGLTEKEVHCIVNIVNEKRRVQ